MKVLLLVLFIFAVYVKCHPIGDTEECFAKLLARKINPSLEMLDEYIPEPLRENLLILATELFTSVAKYYFE